MPSVYRNGPYRFFFYAGDGEEPPHVHVERDANIAKFWLDPVRLQRSGGFRRPELRKVEQMIREAHTELLEAWNDYFSN
jgi:hypothetical protein